MGSFKYIVYPILCFCLLVSCKSNNNAAPEPVKKETTEKSISLPHLVRQPLTRTETPPLMIILHGYGANENDLHQNMAAYLDPKLLVVSLRAPIELGPNRYGWYNLSRDEKGFVFKADKEEVARIQLLKVIDEVIAYYNADSDRVFLMGFSQGAIMSLAASAHSPHKIKGAVLLSGRSPQELLTIASKDKSLNELTLFVSHGTNDNVIAIDEARKMKAQITQLGISKLIYKEHTGAHNLDGAHMREIFNWITQNI